MTWRNRKFLSGYNQVNQLMEIVLSIKSADLSWKETGGKLKSELRRILILLIWQVCSQSLGSSGVNVLTIRVRYSECRRLIGDLLMQMTWGHNDNADDEGPLHIVIAGEWSGSDEQEVNTWQQESSEETILKMFCKINIWHRPRLSPARGILHKIRAGGEASCRGNIQSAIKNTGNNSTNKLPPGPSLFVKLDNETEN